MKNNQFNTYDVKKCCEKKQKLDIVFNKDGKEYNGWFIKDQKKIARITIPKGRKKIGKGLYRAMARQLKLTSSEFDKLLECPLKLDEYCRIIENQGFI